MPKHTPEERRKNRADEEAETKRRRREASRGSTGGVLSRGETDFVLPTRELEELEKRGKIVRRDPLEETFIPRREAETLQRQEGREALATAQSIRESRQEQIDKPVVLSDIDKKKLKDQGLTDEDIAQIESGQIAGLGGVTPVTAADIATLTGAGGAVRGLLRKALPKPITAARKKLQSAKKDGTIVTLFGVNLGLKELIIGGVGFSQATLSKFVSDINTQATTLGTEKNEKIARDMISGLDPDSAIEIYEADIEVLRDSDETLQLISIFFFSDYVGLKVENTHQNIQNQIDGKLSRITEATKFREGLSLVEVQASLNQEELE